jgi:predicted MFS family arabinose efflux permease
LIDDLEISTTDLGLLVSFASGMSALVSPAAGRAVDRVGDRSALLWVFVFGIATLGCMAAAPSFAFMAFALVIAGLCHAGSNPSTNRLISGRVPRGKRGWITGIKQSGETIAIIFAAGVLPAAAVLLGWRAALVVLCAVPAAALVTAALSVKGSRRTSVAAGTAAASEVRSSIYWLSAYSFAMGAAGGSVTAYLPLYAHEVGHLSIAAAGGVMVVAGVVATVSRVLWSRWAEERFGFPEALFALALLAVLAGGVLLAAPGLGPAAFWSGGAIWGASGLAFGAVGMLAVMAEADDSNTGRASGLAVFGFGVGLTCTPPVFGWLVDQGYGFGSGFTLVTAFYALAVGIILLGRPSFRSREARIQTPH